MAQFYTLEEAASKLGLPVADFRRKMQTEWRSLRRFPDGATLRFQSRDIDELARTVGRGSEPELQLGEAPLSLADEEAPLIVSSPPPAAKATVTDEVPLSLADDDALPLIVEPAPAKGPGSAIRRPAKGTTGPDSDVKLELSSAPAAFNNEDTDLIDLDSEQSAFEQGPRTAKVPVSAAKTPSKPSKPAETFSLASDSDLELKPTAGKVPEGSGEFELNLSSDSDNYELGLGDEGSDEVELGAMPVSRDRKGGDSGINLHSPHDSGISLEGSDEFELSLEPDLANAPKSSRNAKPAKPVIPEASDDDGEFELTLDDPSGSTALGAQDKELYETDFELPAVGADEEASDLESSDFDLELGDSVEAEALSDSEVEALDDEDAIVAEEDELVAVDDDDEPLPDSDDEEEEDLVAAGPARQHAWGIVPVLALFPSAIVLFVVGLMSLELVRGMWGYQQPYKANGVIVKSIAELFGGGPFPD